MYEIEEIVYRGYGSHQRKGGGYSCLGVTTHEKLAEALAGGWYRTLDEAISAYDESPKVEPVQEFKAPELPKTEPVVEVPRPKAPDIPTLIKRRGRPPNKDRIL